MAKRQGVFNRLKWGIVRKGQKVEWTPEIVEGMMRLWEEGKSATEISVEFGLPTRNCVIGKLHRTPGFQRRANPAVARPPRPPKPARARGKSMDDESAPKPAPKPKPILPPKPVPAAPPGPVEPLNVTLWDIAPNGCRWVTLDAPAGSRAMAEYCGHASAPGKDYCAYHASRMFVSLKQMKQQQAQEAKGNAWLERKILFNKQLLKA
jgi:hypothetical protein